VSCQHGVGIHFFEARAAVFHDPAGNGFQILLSASFLAPVGFEIPDHDIDAEPFQLVGFSEHLAVLPTPAA
jgi:hypothetical protein